MKKKSLIIVIISVVLILLLSVILYLQKDDSKKYTITFNTDGGKEIKNISANENALVNLPDATKDGYIFRGWYLEDELVNSPYKVVKNVTLKAKFIKEDAKSITVSFDTGDGTEVDNVILLEGETLSLPNNPKKEGYNFLGWVDENNNPVYDNIVIREGMIITALWEEEGKTDDTKKEYYCEDGYDLVGNKCTKTVTTTYTISKDYVCENGSSKNPKNEKECILEVTNSRNSMCESDAIKSFIKDNQFYCGYKEHLIPTKYSDGTNFLEKDALEYCKTILGNNAMIAGIDNVRIKEEEVYVCLDSKPATKKPNEVCGSSKYKLLNNGLVFVCYDEHKVQATETAKYCPDGYEKVECKENTCTCKKEVTVVPKEK